MTPLSQFRRCPGLIGLVMALLCAAGCSRPTSVPPAGATQADQAPFHDHGTKPNGADPLDSSAGRTNEPSENGLPFHDSQNLPAGTLLTVRLKSAITAETPASQTSFEATVDDPVVIEGNTLIPRGAVVAGRIESVRISKVKPNRGYVRLALASVHVGGLDVPVQTASLFARQVPQSDAVIRLEKGRRLTFRLTQPVFLNTQRAQLGQ